MLSIHTFPFPHDRSSRTKTILLTCFVFHSSLWWMPWLAFTLPQKYLFFWLSSCYMKSWWVYSSHQLSVLCWYHYEAQGLLLSCTYFYVTLVRLTFEHHSDQHYFFKCAPKWIMASSATVPLECHKLTWMCNTTRWAYFQTWLASVCPGCH